MNFIEARFPQGLADAATGIAHIATDRAQMRSGKEQVTRLWADPLRSWNAATGVKTLDDLYELQSFWLAVGGPTTAWRWHDETDWRSCPPMTAPKDTDQQIGTGDGKKKAFQLIKTYSTAQYQPTGATPQTYIRKIVKPVAGTVVVAVDGTRVTSTVDTTTGIVTLVSAPLSGKKVTAGFEFDIAAAFSEDEIPQSMRLFELGSAKIVINEVIL